MDLIGKVILISGIIFLVFGIFAVGALSLNSSPLKQNSSLEKNCSNLSLEETTKCLQSEMKRWYNYNISNIKRELSFEELKLEGGVCWHYARWYEEQAKKEGFYAKEITIDINETRAHVFTIISNEKGYCLADQVSVYCINFNQ